MKKVSVIVPVYNAGEYLEKCVETILKQDATIYELLLVDNGSTDGSRERCEAYAKEHAQVRVLYQKEKGASATRNMGLEEAEGEYVVFVDADDYLLGEDTLEYLMTALDESGADIAVGNYFRLWDGSLLSAKSNETLHQADRDSSAFWFEGFFTGGNLSYVWCKMYRRSFLQEHAIVFGNYNYAEDKMFNFKCYVCGASYTFLERAVYVYRKNDNSISFGYRADSCECWMRISEDLQQLLEQRGQQELSGLVANTIFFAVFFDAKMRYIHEGNKMSGVKSVLTEYRSYELARRYFREFASGKKIREIPSLMWRIMMFGFSFAMARKWDWLLALGIKLLVVARVDERLSDTGRRK